MLQSLGNSKWGGRLRYGNKLRYNLGLSWKWKNLKNFSLLNQRKNRRYWNK